MALFLRLSLTTCSHHNSHVDCGAIDLHLDGEDNSPRKHGHYYEQLHSTSNDRVRVDYDHRTTNDHYHFDGRAKHLHDD